MLERIDLSSTAGKNQYSYKAYCNYEIFKMLFGGSPSEWASKLKLRDGKNFERMKHISDSFGLSLDYVLGINLSDECINYQSAPQMQQYLRQWGCTSVALNHKIGQTLDLFTVELALIKDGDATYITMPPYLCLLGMGKHLAMCTNHLFDKVVFDGTPVSHLRRNLLDMTSLEEAIKYLEGEKRTTAVNFMLSDGRKALNIEVTPEEVRIIGSVTNGVGLFNAHTNHVLTDIFHKDTSCSRLHLASQSLLRNSSIPDTLIQPGVVQPISGQFGTIITVWMDLKERIFAYKEPDQTGFTELAA